MNTKVQFYLSQIADEYDPENDIPEGPAVSWVEFHLLNAIYNLEAEIEELKAIIDKEKV